MRFNNETLLESDFTRYSQEYIIETKNVERHISP